MVGRGQIRDYVVGSRTDFGYVTNETMNAVETGLRAFLELP
jgi:hypothetical protein